MPTKPLGIRGYGHIGHLPGSRLGPGDHRVHEGQAAICTLRGRDRHDRIIVTEKLDGSNVCVARVGGELIPLIRAGYRAADSRFEQHHIFAKWVYRNLDVFNFLEDGERLVGEWLCQAHSTRYTLTHAPFVPFDLMRGHEREPWDILVARLSGRFTLPHLLSDGPPLAIQSAISLLGEYGFHGAIDPVEGAVWRVERKGAVDFLAKFVRPGKVDGIYLPEISGKPAVYNWAPE